MRVSTEIDRCRGPESEGGGTETVTCPACGGWNPAEMRFCGHCAAPLEHRANGAPPSPHAGEATTAARHLQEAEQGSDERRLVTALFADLSGFTALASTLDPDTLVEAIDPVLNALSAVVAKYEGFISKFAGDAILALFGAPIAHEDDASRALLVAIEMRNTLDRIRPELLPVARGIEIHTGVNTGYAAGRLIGSDVRMLYDVLGDAVNLAQRLESAAPNGEIYVGETTHALTRERFDLERVDDLTLKGKSEPVPAWRLIGERRRRRRAVSGPSARASRPMVGREHELQDAGRALARLREGRSGLIAVLGEPGVGKTRLTEEVERQAQHRSMRWMQTRCVSYGSGLAYWPFAELLRSFAEIDRSDAPDVAGRALAKALRRVGAAEATPFLARMIGVPAPKGGPNLDELEPEAFRREMHDAFGRWASAVARQGRLVISIEDVHWADASTVELTKHLARGLTGVPILLVLSGRPEAAASLEEITADVDADARSIIKLAPLGTEHTSALIASILGGNGPPELVSFVEERAGGNPFFTEALLGSLRDTGVLYQSDGRWILGATFDAAAVPPTVEGIVSARIDLLPPDEMSVLQVGSVIGRRVLVPLLRSVLDGDPDLDRKLDHLLEGGFLDPSSDTDVLVFHHALVQEVAYSRMLRRRRRELHLKVAKAGEQMYGSGDDVVDLLARHLYLGGAGPEAVDVLIRAGNRAMKLFANAEAILHLEHASELTRGDVGRWGDIAINLADLYELSGAFNKVLTLLEEVREATSDVRGWCFAASTLRVRGEYQQALDLVSKRISVGDFAVMELSQLLLEEGSTLAAAGRYREAIDSLNAGLDAAGRRRTATTGNLLLALARAETVERDLEQAVAHGLDAQSIFEELQDLRGETRSLRVIAAAYHRQNRLDEAAAALRRGLSLAERIGSVEEMGATLINLGMVELDRGALDEAIACDRAAIEQFERVGGGGGRAIGYGNLAEKLLHAERLDEAEESASKALEVAREIQHAHTIADASRTLASIRLRQGRYAEAVDQAENAAALFSEMGIRVDAIDSLKIAAEALGCVGEMERARDALGRAAALEAG